MYSIARTYAIVTLRSPGAWFVVLGAGFLAWAGIALDLFGFDGSEARSIGVVVGTIELAVVTLAVRAHTTGIASAESEGFQAALRHGAGPIPVELGRTVGSAAGAFAVSMPATILVFALYKLFPSEGWGGVGLLCIGLVGEASLAAAWAGFASKLAGRVAAIAIAVGVFIVARCNIPVSLRAILPGPLPLSTSALTVAVLGNALATLGLVLATIALPDSDTERA